MDSVAKTSNRKFRIIQGGKLSGKKKVSDIRKFFIIIIVIITQFVFCKSDFFLIREISVVGVKYIPAEQIVENTGIVGKNIWNVIFSNTNYQIITKIKSLPWVRDGEIRFELPDRVVIEIKERIPVAVVKTDTDSYYIDDEGIVVSSVSTLGEFGLPLIRAVQKEHIIPGEKLKFDNIDKLVACLKSYDTKLLEEFPEVELDNNGELLLYSKDNIQFKMGTADELYNKLTIVPSILKTIRDKSLSVKFVDMRYSKYVLKLNKNTNEETNVSTNIRMFKED